MTRGVFNRPGARVERARIWNVRITTHPAEWLGTVQAVDEDEARLAALATFDIPDDADFDVSPR